MDSSRRLDLEKANQNLIENKAFLENVERELNPTVCIAKRQKTAPSRNLQENYEAPWFNDPEKKHLFMVTFSIFPFIIGLIFLCLAISKHSWLMFCLSVVIFLTIYLPLAVYNANWEDRQPPRKKYTLTGR